MCSSPLSSWAETAEVGLGSSKSHWPIISEAKRPTTVPTDLLECDMEKCVSVVLEANIYELPNKEELIATPGSRLSS